MTKLGVRYIAVLRNREPTAVEPPGHQWTDGDLHHQVGTAVRAHERYTSPSAEHVRTLVADLDALPNADTQAAIDAGDATPAQVDEYAQYHERQWLAHYTELLRVRPDANPDDAIATELVRLRGECERMRCVVNAACVWHDEARDVAAHDRIVGALDEAVDAYRSAAPVSPQPTTTLTPADRVSQWAHQAGSAYYSGTIPDPDGPIPIAVIAAAIRALESEVRRRRRDGLTPAEWSALEDVLRAHARSCGLSLSDFTDEITPPHLWSGVERTQLVTAIDKLTKARST